MKSKRSTSKKYTVGELTKVKGYTTHVDNNDMGEFDFRRIYAKATSNTVKSMYR